MKINQSAGADKKTTPAIFREVEIGDTSGSQYIVKDGKLCFISGKNIVFIREHFADNGLTPEILVENMIRYESKHSLPEKNY